MIQVPMIPPRLVAIAQDKYLKPTNPFADPVNLPAGVIPKYGQDITSGYKRAAPGGEDVGKTPADLKPKMRKLLDIFASADTTGMAKRLFDAYLRDICRPVHFFEDPDLNKAADAHQNIKVFCSAALSAPNSPYKSAAGNVRIHQALKNAGWDIRKLLAPSDLGVPAFNDGNKAFSTGDFANGLGLMINGVQWVYVMATAYGYDPAAAKYAITLKYVFYDVFGLDDDDLKEFGAASDAAWHSNAAIGITAWWQLQHQHGYAPYVTRIVLEKSYECPAV
jgi:hypothetical protein